MSALWNKYAAGRVRDEFEGVRVPPVLTFQTSWQVVADSGLSLARIGDGELLSATMGGGPAFQPDNPDLAAHLKRVATEYRPQCLVGIARPHYYTTSTTRRNIDDYVTGYWAQRAYSANVFELMRLPLYLDACLSIPRHHYDLPDRAFIEYFDGVRDYFRGRNVLLVTGDAETMDSPFFRGVARRVRNVPCLPADAWREHDRIRDDLLRLNGDRSWTVVLACGPTATVLAWELADKMQCLDLGHIVREWNGLLRNTDPVADVVDFYGR